MINGVQFAAVHILDWNRGEINVKKAADIHTPFVRSGSRATEGQDTADRAEVVLGRFRIPLVDGEVLDRRKQSQRTVIHAMYQCAPSATYGAIAHAYVVEISVDLELHLAAVAAATVGLLHGV